MKSRKSTGARAGARRRTFLPIVALVVAVSCLTFALSASAAFAAPASPVISGPTAVQFISHPLGFRGAISWQPVDTATAYRVYDADSGTLISTVTTPTHMVYGLQGTTYRRYVVAVDSVGDTSTPSNTLDIRTVAPVPPASPASFSALPSSIFDLQTSAPASGSVPVEVPYDPTEVVGDPANLKLLHYTGGSWVDITTSVDTSNSIVSGVTTGFSVLAVMEPAATSALPTVTVDPDAAYLARTTKIDFSALPDWSEVAGVDDGVLGVTLSRHMIKMTAGSTTPPSWGVPGEVEETSPAVLFTDFNTSITMQLSRPVYEFGFEAGPSAVDVPVAFTATFLILKDGHVIDTVSRTITGPPASWNARLFAIKSDVPFDEVVMVNDNYAGFAIAQLRYSVVPPAPMPVGVGAAVVTDPVTGLTIGFENVTASGEITVTPLAAGGPTPPQFQLLPHNFFDIATTASFAGQVTITVPYLDADLKGLNEADLKLMHWTGAAWEDITVSLDTTANVIAGRTSSFSPFALAAPAAVTTATVSFDSNGGSAIDTQTVDVGSLVATPVPDPTRTGHAFAGWYADSAFTTPWDFATATVSADMTLYAKWTVNSYHVSFDSNGGSAVPTQTVDFGSLGATPVPDPTRIGHTFAGWYADPALTTPWDFSVDHVGAADMTLYAKWTVNSYQVSFNSNGGSAVPTQTVDFGLLVATPPAPTWDGYHIFGGWYVGTTATPWNFATDRLGAADMSLVATWTPGYKITGSAGAHGRVSVTGATYVPKGGSLTVTITPVPGYGVSTVKVDGVSKGAIRSYTFLNVTRDHTISATFRRVTSTTLSASAKTISKGRSVTLYARLKSSTGTFHNTYLLFEVKLPGSHRYILLKKMKVSSTGRAHYHYQVLNRGTRYHRVRFTGDATFLAAPVKRGVALRVR